MNRLLTVVNERKKLRSEYRRHLEDQYIGMKKTEEREQVEAEIMKLREQGIKTPMTEDEQREFLRKRSENRHQQIEKTLNEMKAAAEREDTAIAPLITDKDFNILTQAKVNLTQNEILKMYVKNANELDLKQRRTVYGAIQAQRAKHAKEVFLKELSALGRKLKD